MTDHEPTGVEGQLRVALDNMPGALACTDGDPKMAVCNDRFKEMYKEGGEVRGSRPLRD